MRQHILTFIIVVVAAAGIGLMSYPTVSNLWNQAHQSRAVASYVEQVENMDSDDSEAMLAAAREYNETLIDNTGHWTLTDDEKAEYESLLDISGTGIMGYIYIPKIDCTLPIYHGTDEGALQIAIGHLEGSSLPVGGSSTHAVLTGHRGLPSARLFTDLDQMEEGDLFIISVLGEKMAYEVDQIKTVLPEEMDDLEIIPGEDHVTLVTCTPYGINTHRLLVRGIRTDYTEEEEVQLPEAKNLNAKARAMELIPVGIAVLTVLVAMLIIRSSIRRGRKKKR